MKWNMGWMHDMLDYFAKDPVFRKYHQQQHHVQHAVRLHREFRAADFARRSGARQAVADVEDAGRRMAALRQRARVSGVHVRRIPARSCCSWACEIGQTEEWNHDASLPWHLLQWPVHHKLQTMVRELNWLYRREPALYEVDDDYSGFEWIDFRDAEVVA